MWNRKRKRGKDIFIDSVMNYCFRFLHFHSHSHSLSLIHSHSLTHFVKSPVWLSVNFIISLIIYLFWIIRTGNFVRSNSIKRNLFQSYKGIMFAQNVVLLCTNGRCYLPKNKTKWKISLYIQNRQWSKHG